MELAAPEVLFDAQMSQLASAPPDPQASGQAQAPEQGENAEAPQEQPSGDAPPADDPAADTTQEPDGTAKPAAPASVLPKEVEPFKDFLQTKGLDPKAADFAPRVLQMAKEAESLIGQKATEARMIAARAESMERDFALGGIDAVNRWRESNGLPKIEAETRSYDDRIREQSELISHINNALQGNEDSLKWLNQTLLGKLEDLKLDARIAQRQGNAPVAAQYQKFQQDAQSNFNKFTTENKDKLPHLEALAPLFQKGGLLHSHGIDAVQMASTPERLASWAKIGEAVSLLEVDPKTGKSGLDTLVEQRVQQAMDMKRKAANAGRPNGVPGLRNGVATTPTSGSPIDERAMWMARHN